MPALENTESNLRKRILQNSHLYLIKPLNEGHLSIMSLIQRLYSITLDHLYRQKKKFGLYNDSLLCALC